MLRHSRAARARVSEIISRDDPVKDESLATDETAAELPVRPNDRGQHVIARNAKG